MDDYRDINRANWDERAPAHATSPDYNVQGFVDDPAFISGVVRFDRPLLGDLSGLRGSTFERDEPLVWGDGGTYVETDAVFTANTTHSWNHGLGEIATALIAEGMHIAGLVEHDSVPWEALPGQMTRDDRGEWRLTDRPWRLAASYTLQAVRSA